MGTESRQDGIMAASGDAPVSGCASKARWFVAIVNSRHEKKVAEQLKALGIECYVAVQREMRVWKNGRRKMVDRVVIPSVVFVRCVEKQRREIVAFSFILRFMVNRSVASGGLHNPVAVIADEQIRKLQFMLGQSDIPVNFVSARYRVHDNVRVIRGQLAGLEGEIMRNSDGTNTLTVGIPLLGGATVMIDPLDVELIAGA